MKKIIIIYLLFLLNLGCSTPKNEIIEKTKDNQLIIYGYVTNDNDQPITDKLIKFCLYISISNEPARGYAYIDKNGYYSFLINEYQLENDIKMSLPSTQVFYKLYIDYNYVAGCIWYSNFDSGEKVYERNIIL